MGRPTPFLVPKLFVILLSGFALIAPNLLGAQVASTPRSKAPLSMVLGEPRSVQVAKPFGMLTDTVPIIVPPGRRDVQPHLNLTYRSGGGNGILGVGWDINLGYIELNRRNGIPASGDPDTYNFSIAGVSGELHNDGTGVYHSRTELVYREFRKVVSGWEMRDGQGNRYTFDTIIPGALWLLTFVDDPSGNRIEYTYLQDQGAYYPQEIAYTATTTGGSPDNTIVFSYLPRPDVRNTFVHGVSETQALRLSSIAEHTTQASVLARTYEFSYGQTSTGQSVLEQVNLVGDDGTSIIPLRSKMTYTNTQEGWNQGAIAQYTQPFQFTLYNGDDYGTRMLDIDGDGCADVIYQGRIYLGDCKGGFSPSDPWSRALGTQGVNLPPIVSVTIIDSQGNVTTQDNSVRFLDLNGDGRPDILIANPSIGRTEVWLNTYNPLNPASIGWTKAANWTFPSETSFDPATGKPNCAYASSSVFPFTLAYQGTDSSGNTVPGAPAGVNIADVNGDGLPDLVWWMRQDSSPANVCIAAVYINNGAGWVRNNGLSTFLSQSSYQNNSFFISDTHPEGWDLFDVNGDGKADIIFTGHANYQAVYLGTGSTWAYDQNWTNSLVATGVLSIDSNYGPTGYQPVDFNHDGLTDIVVSNSGSPVKAFRNTGTGFAEDTNVEQQMESLPRFIGTIGSNNYAQTATLADINGDGILDLVATGYAPNLPMYLGSGGFPGVNLSATGLSLPEGLLNFSESALGEYVYTQYDRAPSFLPLPQFVPTSLIRTEARADNTSPQNTYTYSYSGGTYTDRKFLGFYAAEETQPNGDTVHTAYDQRELFVGQEGVNTIVDASGSVRYQKVSIHAPVTPQVSPEIQQGVLVSSDEIFYDPGPNGSPVSYTSHVDLSYDDRLNVTRKYKNPNTSVPGLDTTAVYLWVRNDNAAIWTLPYAVTVYSGNAQSLATLVSNSVINYDNQLSGATRGLITSEQDAVQVQPNVVYVTRNTAYDQYGNVVSVTDRNGNTSSYAYDAGTSTYRLSAKDQEGRTISSTFDPRFGAVLTDTDASGNVTSSGYDAFGRLTRVAKPGDASFPTGTTSYSFSPLPPTTTGFYSLRIDSTSNGGLLSSVDYFDSFGQVYKTARSAANGKTIFNTTDTDDMSLPIRMSRPYFQGDTPNYTTITRDPMHRITQILDPDGLSTTRSYAGLQVSETDRRGLTTVTVLNPSNQITTKILPTATGTATTQYTFDVSNQLTKVTRADGSVSTTTYDLLGRKTSLADPNTGNFFYQYDNEGHLTAVTGPDGKVIKYVYNRTGDLVSRTYPDGSTNTVTYGVAGQSNAVGRMVSVKDAAGTLKFVYDARGRAITRKRYVSAKEKTYVTRYAYDSADRLTSLTYPDGYLVNYAYDQAGNVASVTDGSGLKLASNFAYTAGGRLMGLAYGNGTSSNYGYDVLDRMVNLQSSRPTGTFMQNLSYSYDADSNVAAIQDGVSGYNQQFQYDSMNRLVSAQGVGYGTETYSYDAIGNLLTKGPSAFVMDPLHPERATCMLINATGLYPNPATACAQSAFGTTAINYDAHGNVARLGSLQYGYDSENRMVSQSSGGTVIERNIYDFWGDRVVQKTANETRVFIDDVYEEGATGALHHVKTQNLLLATVVTPITTQEARLPVPVLPATLQRPPAKPLDPRYLLASLLGLALFTMLLSSALRVSGSGRRLRVRFALPRLAPTGGMQFRTGMLVLALIFSMMSYGVTDGWAMDAPPAAVAPPSGIAAASTQVAAVKPPAQHFYYHLNHLGGVNLVSDDSGNVVAQREYKPYGEVYVNGGGPSNSASTLPFGFQGQRFDGENGITGLDYFNARFYNPQIGRFMSADTEIHNPTAPQALNRYAFAGGNPIRYVDPTGHSWWDFLIGAAIIVAIVVFAAVSGGSGLALFAIALSGVGLGVGAAVAAGLGYNITSEGFWQIALTGAILGAAIGAGLGQLALESGDAEATAAVGEADLSEIGEASDGGLVEGRGYRAAFGSMLKSMAFGGPQAVLVNELNGGGTDNLLLSTSIGVGGSAVTGAVTGAISGTGSSALRIAAVNGFYSGLGRQLVIQGALYTFAGLTKQSFGHWVVFDRGIRLDQSHPRTVQGYYQPDAYYSDASYPPLTNPTPY